MQNEPSMEEILTSIRRIIADEDRGQGPRAPRRSAGAHPRLTAQTLDDIAQAELDGEDDAILELTDAFREDPEGFEEPRRGSGRTEAAPEPRANRGEARTDARSARPGDGKAGRIEPKAALAAAVLSETSAKAARESLDHLSKLLVRNDDGQSNTLEALVREMLRPMLKDWLDSHLPDLVETMVKREIDRITGRV